MKVSIITVCLNAAETIEDTIKSVLSQDYKDIEYIIVDGGSTDSTPVILTKYKSRISKCISELDNGIYEAMNKGINSSTGDVIAFLNSDDTYRNQTIVSQIVTFIQSKDLYAAYGDLEYVKRNNTNQVTRLWKPGEYKKGAFRYGWAIPHPTFFCKKEIFERFGYFNDKLKIAADFELTLRFIEKHRIKIGYLPKTIVQMRTAGKANILKGMILGNREIIKSFQLNGIRMSPWFFISKPLTKISQLLANPKRVQKQ